jgi:hypothetical protein
MNETNSSGTEDEDARWIETEKTAVQYNPSTKTYRAVHNWHQGDSLSTTVLMAIDAVVDEQISDLPSLIDDVDPDSLNSIFKPTKNSQRTTGRITIPFAGFLVTIYADGEVTFQRLTNS